MITDERIHVIPNKTYIICATPRSGSNLLCDLLNNTGVAGHPGEFILKRNRDRWFDRYHVANYNDLIPRIFEGHCTSNGVFGIKIMWHHFEFLLGELKSLEKYRTFSHYQILNSLFPNLHFIHLTRLDKVRQAVSFATMSFTKVSTRTRESKRVNMSKPRFDYGRIHKKLSKITEQDANWLSFFERYHIKPITVEYEALSRSSDRVVERLIKKLAVGDGRQVLKKTRLIKQSNLKSELWVLWFRVLRFCLIMKQISKSRKKS